MQLSVDGIRDDGLSGPLSENIDHIVVLHVICLVFGPSARETRELRQGFMDRLGEESRKRSRVLDKFERDGELSTGIEQKQRALVTDDVMP